MPIDGQWKHAFQESSSRSKEKEQAWKTGQKTGRKSRGTTIVPLEVKNEPFAFHATGHRQRFMSSQIGDHFISGYENSLANRGATATPSWWKTLNCVGHCWLVPANYQLCAPQLASKMKVSTEPQGPDHMFLCVLQLWLCLDEVGVQRGITGKHLSLSMMTWMTVCQEQLLKGCCWRTKKSSDSAP